jgi:hypothetical protein
LDFGCRASEGKIIVVGGGGEARTGVPSAIVIFDFKHGKFRKLQHFDTHPLTFMKIAIHPTEEVHLRNTN